MGTEKVAAKESSARPAASPEAASAAPVSLLQRLGNENLQRLLSARVLQAKMSVSSPDDPYEQEADRVADQVMRMPASAPQVATHAAPVVQRACSKCEEELQRSEESAAVPTIDAALESSISALSGRGEPLPHAVRSFMEPRFDADFSAVRVHTDAGAHELARAVNAQAFTIGHNVVFGAGHYAPETDTGKRLLAHELTHTIQQRGTTGKISRVPNDWECNVPLLHANREALPAKTWLKCHRLGKTPPDPEGVLRWAKTGEIFTKERLLEWAVNQDTPQDKMLAQIMSSLDFIATPDTREGAAIELTLALRKVPLQKRRDERVSQWLANEEREQQQKEAAERARASKEKRARHSRWIAGEGTINRPTLETPGSPRQDRSSGAVSFQTYDENGEVTTLTFPDTDAYADAVRKQIEHLQKRTRDLPDEVFSRYKLDRKVVAEVLAAAPFWARPGLALPGVQLGFSKLAIMHGVIAAKYATLALNEAKAAVHELDKGRGTQAAQRLNEARLLFFQAKHSLHKMLRTQDEDNQASLDALESYSKAGDDAAMFLPAPLQIGLGAVKNAGVRVSTMYADPNAEFGFGSFAWQTAVSVAAVKGQKLLLGANPSFVRAAGVGVATNQVSKALVAGDASKLVEFNATELAFAAGGAAHSSWARARAAKAAGPIHVNSVGGGKGGDSGGHSDGTVVAGPDADTGRVRSDGTAGVGPDADTGKIRLPPTRPSPVEKSGELHSPASLPEHVPDDSAAIRAIHTPGNDLTRLSQKSLIRYLRSLKNKRIDALLGPIERGEGRIIFNAKDAYGRPRVEGHTEPLDPATRKLRGKNIYINFDRALGIDIIGEADLTRDPIHEGAVITAHELQHVDDDFSGGYDRGHELRAFQAQRLVDPSSVFKSDIALKQWIDQEYANVPAPPGWYDDHHQLYPIPPGGIRPPRRTPLAVSGASQSKGSSGPQSVGGAKEPPKTAPAPRSDSETTQPYPKIQELGDYLYSSQQVVDGETVRLRIWNWARKGGPKTENIDHSTLKFVQELVESTKGPGRKTLELTVENASAASVKATGRPESPLWRRLRAASVKRIDDKTIQIVIPLQEASAPKAGGAGGSGAVPSASSGFDHEEPTQDHPFADVPTLTGQPSVGARAGAPKERTRTFYRFADITNPQTLTSRAGLSERSAATAAAIPLHEMPFRAEAHARFGIVKDSPLVSVGESVDAMANSPDRWLQTIATGRPGMPGVQRAPFIVVFEIPESRLYRASNSLSVSETEWLFYGEDLIDFMVGAMPNPFQ